MKKSNCKKLLKKNKKKNTNNLANSMEFQDGLLSSEYFINQGQKKEKFHKSGDQTKQLKDINKKMKNTLKQGSFNKKLKEKIPKKSLKDRSDIRQNSFMNFINISINSKQLNYGQDESFKKDVQLLHNPNTNQDTNINRNFFLSSINNPEFNNNKKSNKGQRLSINSTNFQHSNKSSYQRDKNSLLFFDQTSSQEHSRKDHSRNRDLSSFMLNDTSQDSWVENKTLEKKIRKPNLNKMLIQQKNNKQIIIEFINNYGSSEFIGLNEVKLFDRDCQEVLLVDQVFSIHDKNQLKQNIKVSNINNGIVKTNNSKFMLCLDYQQQINQYSLNITVSEHNDCQYLVIWNYNDNFRIGVKNCNIYFQNKKVFEGILNKGNEQTNDGSYFTIISLQNKSLENLKYKLLKEYGILTNSSITTKKSVRDKKEKQKFDFIQIPQKQQNITQLKSVHDVQKIDQDVYKKRNYSEDQTNNKNVQDQFSYFKAINPKEQDNSSQSKYDKCSQDLLSSQVQTKVHKQFLLPDLPNCQQIHFYVISTWGNRECIQINQIQILNSEGDIIQPLSVVIYDTNNQIIKFNVQLLFRQDDQKIIKNENCKLTLDSLQKMKFPIRIKVQFFDEEKISMIRIINYYGSRANQNQAIKKLIIKSYPNKQVLFKGFIRKMKSNLTFKKIQDNTILYTQDASILKKVLKNDKIFRRLKRRNQANPQRQIQRLYKNLKTKRPITIQKTKKRSQYFQIKKFLKQEVEYGEQLQELTICVKEMWDYNEFKGFKNINFIQSNQKELQQNKDFLIYSQNKKNRIKQIQNFKLNQSNFKANKIKIVFTQQVNLIKIQFYQLKQSPVKALQLKKENDQNLQENKKIFLFVPDKNVNQVFQEFDLPLQKKVFTQFNNQENYIGFTLQFYLLSTYGDPFYIGLNGIEIYDEKGNNIFTHKNKTNFILKGFPEGVHHIYGMENDSRKLENLYSSQNQSNQYQDIWLAPFTKDLIDNKKNSIYIQFKYPQSISLINIWNYLKTPQRGVQELMIKLDNQVIFLGNINNPNNVPLSSISLKQIENSEKYSSIQTLPIKNYNKRQVLFNNEGHFLQDQNQDINNYTDIRPYTGVQKNNSIFKQLTQYFYINFYLIFIIINQ